MSNTCKFITTLTSELDYCTTHYIKSTNIDDIATGIQEAFKIYQNTPYLFTTINSDNEFSTALTKYKTFLNTRS